MANLLKIIAVGKVKETSFAERCDEYARRVRRYGKLEVTEIADSDRETEGRGIVRELSREGHAFKVAFSEEGREFTTSELAKRLSNADRKMVLVIGGPFGLTDGVKSACDEVWSLSRLTFTHEMARMLLLEQLYRVLNLNSGGHYHH